MQLRIASGLLGMPVRRQFVVMLTPWAIGLVAGGCLALILGVGSLAPLVVGFLLLHAYTLVMALTPSTVRLGREGLGVSWLVHRRFIPFADISAARVYLDVGYGKESHGVSLVGPAGEVVRLPTGAGDAARAVAAQLLEEVERGRARVDRDPPALPDAIARRDASPADRALALRRLTHVDDLRTSAVPLERLLRIVESDAASTAERASAALAAVASGESAARERVRIVSETTSFPELQSFLSRAVALDEGSATDEALAEELAQLERRGRSRA